jgi:hypothetical protein
VQLGLEQEPLVLVQLEQLALRPQFLPFLPSILCRQL